MRTSKTNQEGDAADVRYLKNGAAKAIRTLRAADADAAPTDRVISALDGRRGRNASTFIRLAASGGSP